MKFKGEVNTNSLTVNGNSKMTGSLTITGSLQIQSGGIQLPLITRAASTYYVLSTDYTIVCNALTSPMSVYLPTASLNTNRIYNIKRRYTSLYPLTVIPSNTESIDGISTINLANADSLTVQSDGIGWVIL